MFKKIKITDKNSKFQIGDDYFLTKLPTYRFTMYQYDIGLNFVDKLDDCAGSVTAFSNGGCFVSFEIPVTPLTIFHEAVHVKQAIEKYWHTTFDIETEAIIVSQLCVFLVDRVNEYNDKKKKKKKKK